jgi:CRP-like cAMP-binding protein
VHAPNLQLNSILTSLPEPERAGLSAHLKEVSLTQGTVLQDEDVKIEHIYFPTSGMVSVLIASPDGHLIETALVGKEGIVNSFAGIGLKFGINRSVMQVAGTALRIDEASFTRLLHSQPHLRSLVDRYHVYLLVQAQQVAACNLLHPIEARLCRWLAQVHDRVEEAKFDLTQEFIAQMLGVSRPTVNLALSQLKSANLIRTHRRLIEITDLDGLEASACDCYALLKEKMKDIV